VRLNDDTVAIMPKDIKDIEKSPYISYNCIRLAKNAAVISNGSQTDPIAEKIAIGYPPRDAIALGLLAMDCEKDSHGTPRIAAVLSGGMAYLGIVTKDGISVSGFQFDGERVLHGRHAREDGLLAADGGGRLREGRGKEDVRPHL